MPQYVAAASTSQNSVLAKVQRWIFGTEAWAATVDEITALVVRVTGPGLLSPVEDRVTVNGATSGQTIPITLEVPVGTDRVFTVSAVNAANRPIFQGQSEPLDLTAGQAATANVRLTDTTIRITTTGLPDGTDDRSYTATLLAERGSGAVTWTIQNGVLPPGVSLNGSTGVLSGTPTTVGVFPITVRVTDSSALFDEERLSIRINAAPIPPRITTTRLPDGTVGNSYSTTVVATGGTGAPTWSVNAGALPPGLTLDGVTGAIAGTPRTEGTFNFTVSATDTVPLTGEKALSIQINPAPIPPTITTTELPNGTVNARYNQTLTATGGTGARTWSVSAGNLPPGLTLNSTTGVITGTPTTAGPVSFTVRATDMIPLSNEKALTITIVEAPVPPEITTTTLPGGRVGDSYSGTLAATSMNGAVTWSTVAGTLPPGLNLNSATGAITGTPTSVGTVDFRVRATDTRRLTDEQDLAIQISDRPNPPVITTSTLPGGTVGAQYGARIEATGGNGALTWTTVSGSCTPTPCALVDFLPQGLTLDKTTGVIAGTPLTKPTITTVVVRVTDTLGQTDRQEFTIRTISPLTITTTSLPAGCAIFNRSYKNVNEDPVILSASGGIPPYTWSLPTIFIPGAPPFAQTPAPGLQLSSGGVISGTPSTGGVFTRGYIVRDASGAVAEKSLSIFIADGEGEVCGIG